MEIHVELTTHGIYMSLEDNLTGLTWANVSEVVV